ncbi:MAG: hypothetical protein ACM32E_10930 [Gemmatimonadota bacterium]
MTRTEAEPARTGAPRPRPARRWARLAGLGLAAAALFACFLRLSQTRAVNSDGAANTLQAWDMLHGNLLLHGWQLTDVSFYTTELPQYLLVTAVTGLTAEVVHIAAAMTMTLLVILAGLLSGRGRANRAGAALAAGLLLTPQLGPGVNILLSSPDHLGTAVPVLAAWLILDRARPGPAAAAAVGLVLGWAQVADPLAFWIGVLPLAGVCALRGLRGCAGARRYDLGLAAAALAGSALAAAAGRAITAAGGFRVAPVHVAPVKPGHLLTNLAVTGRGLLLLFGADFPDARPGLATVLAVAHLAGVALAAWALFLAARCFRRGGDRVAQVLLAGVLLDVVAYAISDRPHALPATREIDVVLPLCAALAGRLAGPRLARWLGRQGSPARHPAARFAAGFAAGLILAGYLASLATGLTRPAATAEYHRLGAWLAARHLRDGLAGYWAASVVTADTGGRVRIRPVRTARGRLAAGRWAADAAWYDPRRATADYVVLAPGRPGYPGFAPRRQVLATFGRPARTYHAAGCVILVWHRNLLASLGRAQFQNSKGSSMRSPARNAGSSSGSRPG